MLRGLSLRATRRWRVRMIGLTGAVASGKSQTLRLLAGSRWGRGVLSQDADAIVHWCYCHDRSLIQAMAALAPSVVVQNSVNRTLLSQWLLRHPEQLATIEAIVHCRVREHRERWLISSGRMGVRLAICDVPLLFETNAQRFCDGVIVVQAPDWLRWQRLQKRGMARFAQWKMLNDRQWSAARKRCYANDLVKTGLGRRRALLDLVRALGL